MALFHDFMHGNDGIAQAAIFPDAVSHLYLRSLRNNESALLQQAALLFSPVIAALRAAHDPFDEFFLRYDNAAAHTQSGEARFVHQLINAGDRNAQHLCHQFRVEEQRQFIVAVIG